MKAIRIKEDEAETILRVLEEDKDFLSYLENRRKEKVMVRILQEKNREKEVLPPPSPKPIKKVKKETPNPEPEEESEQEDQEEETEEESDEEIEDPFEDDDF